MYADARVIPGTTVYVDFYESAASLSVEESDLIKPQKMTGKGASGHGLSSVPPSPPAVPPNHFTFTASHFNAFT